MRSHRTLRRSLDLLRAFRLEQSDPDRLYALLASDAARLLSDRMELRGAVVLDVGGGAGYFTKAFRSVGAVCFIAEPDLHELSWRGAAPDGAVMADGYRLPFRSGVADLVVLSNVLEHVERPYDLLDELARVIKPAGHLWLSFTNWYSPWGGHESSPWHYLGAERAATRYERQRGRPPKNLIGESLFKVHVGPTLKYLSSHPDLEVVEAGPRYHPTFARGVVRVPLLREIATWNLELLLKRRATDEPVSVADHRTPGPR